jgi:hypothetical protein
LEVSADRGGVSIQNKKEGSSVILLNLQSSFETQSSYQKFKCSKIEVVWVKFVTWKIFFYMHGKQTHSMEFVSQYEKNHEQKHEHTCYVPCLTHCRPVHFNQRHAVKAIKLRIWGARVGYQITPDPSGL